jgi:plasmid stability protein
MPDVLIRGLEPETVRRLKARAKRHGRSLQGEVKSLIEQAASDRTAQVEAILERCRQRFAGRRFSSSVPLIREDRNR